MSHASKATATGKGEGRQSSTETRVIVFDRYEELLDTPEYQDVRAFAHTLLKRHAVWWEPTYAKAILHGTKRRLLRVVYRITAFRLAAAVPSLISR